MTYKTEINLKSRWILVWMVGLGVIWDSLYRWEVNSMLLLLLLVVHNSARIGDLEEKIKSIAHTDDIKHNG